MFVRVALDQVLHHTCTCTVHFCVLLGLCWVKYCTVPVGFTVMFVRVVLGQVFCTVAVDLLLCLLRWFCVRCCTVPVGSLLCLLRWCWVGVALAVPVDSLLYLLRWCWVRCCTVPVGFTIVLSGVQLLLRHLALLVQKAPLEDPPVVDSGVHRAVFEVVPVYSVYYRHCHGFPRQHKHNKQ